MLVCGSKDAGLTVAVPAGTTRTTRTAVVVVVPARGALTTGTTRTGTIVVPTRATTVAPAGAAVRVPIAGSVPVIPVVRVAVTIEIVVAAAPVPVVTPARVPELTRAPVVIGHRSGRPGKSLGYARRAQTGKSKTCGEGRRGCNSFGVFHGI